MAPRMIHIFSVISRGGVEMHTIAADDYEEGYRLADEKRAGQKGWSVRIKHLILHEAGAEVKLVPQPTKDISGSKA